MICGGQAASMQWCGDVPQYTIVCLSTSYNRFFSCMMSRAAVMAKQGDGPTVSIQESVQKEDEFEDDEEEDEPGDLPAFSNISSTTSSNRRLTRAYR